MSINESKEWSHVPAGSLKRLAEQLPAEKQEQAFRPYLVGALLGLMLAAVIFGFSIVRSDRQLSPDSAIDSPALVCAEVLPLLADYHQHNLPADTYRLVHAHLEYCEMCRSHYETEFGGSQQLLGLRTLIAAVVRR